ncbi:hypothetical protein FQR65_LT06771 [Abscondita terminalis]|nr:hypothetical protein FQR65_LT06771 [Abscondita terminalis]
MKREADGEMGAPFKRSRRGDEEVRILIPSKVAGAIIGKGGQNITKLRSQYKASITVPDCPGPERMLTLSSDLDTVCNIVNDVVPNLEENGGRVNGDELDLRMMIHQSQAGCVIGKQGTKIKEIREKTGARIKIFSNCAPQSTDRVIQIIGQPSKCIDTIREILTLIKSSPIKGPVNPYDPHNFDDFYADEYGGYGNGQGGGGGGGGGSDNRRGSGGPPHRGGGGGGGGGGGPRPSGNSGDRDSGGRFNRGPPPRGGPMGVSFNDRGGMGGGIQSRNSFGGPSRGLNGGPSPFSRGEDAWGRPMNQPSSMMSGGGGNHGPLHMGGGGGGMSGHSNGGSGHTSTQVTIPKDLAGAIIGKGGGRIRKIRQDSGAGITIDEPLMGSNDRIITISGTSNQIQMAQYLLQQRQLLLHFFYLTNRLIYTYFTEYLAEAVYITVDPYMRAHTQSAGTVLMGQQVAKIIESKVKGYEVGKYVIGGFGWRSHTIAKPRPKSEPGLPQHVLDDIGDLPLSLYLGVLGMPGNTAYFGFLDVCQPKDGETVVVTGAAGAVGSHVGQIAKIKGCKVIGIVGSDSKGKWITEDLGFDHYINYKNANIKEELAKYAPKGIDCYFDNVGGEISSTIISMMNPFGRISVCGCISQYNNESEVERVPLLQKYFIMKMLKMQGIMAFQFLSRWEEGIQQNLKWIQEGKLKYRETVTEGFENTYQAFLDMLNGKNVGKAIVKILFRYQPSTQQVTMNAKKYILKQEFVGFPKLTDVEIVEEKLPPLKDGEYLAEAVYITVDPYMRVYPQNVGNVLMGQQVAKIIESNVKDYEVGKYVVGTFGWRTHTIAKPQPPSSWLSVPQCVLEDIGDLPLSLYLGVLGMPGMTAYFGFLDICQPKEGETVVVTGAAGAVGSHVGQIAKIKGCKVIGIVGSDSKGKWITEDLGFDHYINYKNANIREQLAKYAPKGIDCYFDNVGGEISSTIISMMNPFGRISVCGSISQYNESELEKVTVLQKYMVMKMLRMQGFLVSQYVSRWEEGVQQNLKWIKEGKLKYKETITEGFENTYQAFLDMLNGKNFGKAVVKV